MIQTLTSANGFRTPSWHHRSIDPLQVTDEQMVAWEQETNECLDFNRVVEAERKSQYSQLLQSVLSLYGQHSNVYKYMVRNPPLQAPRLSFSYLRQRVVDARAKAEQEARAKREVMARSEWVQRAVAWLRERGKVEGVDFERDDAVKVANHLAYEEEVARLLSGNEGLFSFNGQNCEDDGDRTCGGWDGESRRCDCGNRRVYWAQGYGHSFENPYVYAEAY